MQIFLFVLGALLVISRRPDAITTPQFFAEDGAVFFADAYRLTFFHQILLPDSGYLVVFLRLVAWIATLVPLLYAPLLTNLIGLTVQVLPVNLLASGRLATLGSLGFRMMLAFVYLALPNSRELDVVLTNSQWHLALIACLLIVAIPPRHVLGRAVDLLILGLTGLTGPFCVILFPVNLILWWFRRARWRLITALVLAVCALLQFIHIQQADPNIRYKAPLGASVHLLINFLSSHVFLASIFGSANYTARVRMTVLSLIAIGGIAVITFAAIKAKWEFRALLLFSMLVFAATLKSPLVSRTVPQWQVLDEAYGIRYWFFPMLAFLWALLWIANSRTIRLLRWGTMAVLLLSVAGMARDWQYPSFSDHNFPKYVAQFESLPAGEAMAFPLYPDGWSMQLVKGTKCHISPFGAVDLPAEGQRTSGVLPVRGWANGAGTIKDVQILIDNAQAADIIPSVPRPDVDAQYPGSPNKLKGWEASIDTTKLAAGNHQLTSRARLINGCSAILGIRSFQVAH
jgi:hypothetical protein